jgi:hypothetical protein
MVHLIGKLIESILGKDLTRVVFGWMGILLGGAFSIVYIVVLIQSVRERRRRAENVGSPSPDQQAVFLDSHGMIKKGTHAEAETPPVAGPIAGAVISSLFLVIGIFMVLDLPRKTDQERAIEAIEELKGRVERDPTRPGNPVVKVSFRDSLRVLSGRLKDKDLKSLKPHLEALTELRELNLVYADITDEGLDYLKDLKQLKTLSLGEMNSLWSKKLSQNRVDELRDSLPETRITFYQDGTVDSGAP